MAPYRLSKLDWIGLLGFCGSSGVILYPELRRALAARALMFAKSVPLRLRGHTRPAYLLRLLCPWVMRGDYPLGALKRRWLRSGVIRSPLRPDCPIGIGLDWMVYYLWPRNWTTMRRVHSTCGVASSGRFPSGPSTTTYGP